MSPPAAAAAVTDRTAWDLLAEHVQKLGGMVAQLVDAHTRLVTEVAQLVRQGGEQARRQIDLGDQGREVLDKLDQLMAALKARDAHIDQLTTEVRALRAGQ